MLSKDRVGAIIAIEREIGLRNYIEGGIPLDAKVSYDLLVTIFNTESHLHDGAVIVHDDRIAAAACFLPLTVNPRLSRELGSRHRAAIGLTEENDSVAVVVSEETGKISLVLDGNIERGLTPGRAAEPFAPARLVRRERHARAALVLVRLMAMQVFRHIGLKLLSLALAVLLWSLVAGQKEAERSLRVPLEFQNMPASLEMIGEPPSFVDVRVKGPSATLGQLRGTELVVNGRALGSAAGPAHVPPAARSRDAPRWACARSTSSPPPLPSRSRHPPRKTVPVVPAIDGEPAAGLRAGTRDRVTRIGRSRRARRASSRQLTEATTEPVNLRGAMGRVRDTVTIGVPESSVRLKVPRNAVVVVDVKPGPGAAHGSRRARHPAAPQARRCGPRVAPPSVTVRAAGAGRRGDRARGRTGARVRRSERTAARGDTIFRCASTRPAGSASPASIRAAVQVTIR